MKGQNYSPRWIIAAVSASVIAAALPATVQAQYQSPPASQSDTTKAAQQETKKKKKKGEQAAPEPGADFSPEFRKQAPKVQKSINEKKWAEVIAALPALDALPGLTPDDLKVLATWRLQATQATGDTDGFTAAIETYLEKGYALPEQIGPMHQQLAAYYNGKQDRAKTVTHYRQFIDMTPDAESDELQTLGKLYLQTQNYTEAAQWLGKAIDVAKSGGEQPDEAWFQLRDRCYVELKDQTGRLDNLEALVGYYPNKEYYSRIVAVYQTETKDDRTVMLNAYRVAVADPKGGLATVGGYLGYADTALVAGSPGEAARGLERGMKEGIVPSAGSNQASLQEARTAIALDRKSLPGESTAAAKNPKGEIAVKVGLGYYSTGDYEKAVEMIRLGITKGGVTRLDDANLLLGAALMELGRRDEAKAAFEAAAAAAGANAYMARIAGLWLVRAGRQDAAPAGG
ncbi:MAG: Tetratricopeptide repeat protein [Steroidobacteraceae bacterium]|nr:Tetratricopeptide repeat protein [Steroidobacteraceae bacterium]